MLQQKIKSDSTDAMKARDQLRLDTLRGLSTAFVNELVVLKKMPTDELPDDVALTVIRREVKKRKEAAEAFKTGGRTELAEKEEKERVILEAYLPAMMSREDIMKIAQAKKAEMGVTDKKEAGKFMGALMKELQGKADGADVKAVIDSLFA